MNFKFFIFVGCSLTTLAIFNNNRVFVVASSAEVDDDLNRDIETRCFFPFVKYYYTTIYYRGITNRDDPDDCDWIRSLNLRDDTIEYMYAICSQNRNSLPHRIAAKISPCEWIEQLHYPAHTRLSLFKKCCIVLDKCNPDRRVQTMLRLETEEKTDDKFDFDKGRR